MRIFYDTDTQDDFMNAGGALYVPGAEKIKGNLQRLTHYAIHNRIPILGSVDWHYGTAAYAEREVELQRNGGPFPDHCMENTLGALKIPETRPVNVWMAINNGILVAADRCEVLSTIRDELVELYIANPLKQDEATARAVALVTKRLKEGLPITAYLQKQHYDVFTNPAAERILRDGKVTESVDYGVATDYCVKAAVLGKQKRGIQCYVVEDAIMGITPESTQAALEEMVAAGAKVVRTKDILEGRI